MTYWYLGSPYSKHPGGLEAAFQEVCVEAGRLITAGIPVFAPIAHSHSIARVAKMDYLSYGIWLPADRPLMDAASGLIVLCLPSWKSSIGLTYEISVFREASKPIVYMTPGVIPELFLSPRGVGEKAS